MTIYIIALFLGMFAMVYPQSVIAQENIGSTFTSKGWIDSTVVSNETKPYLAGGWWNLLSVNGEIQDFNADFTMVGLNGSDRHEMGFTNFKQSNDTKVILEQNGFTSIDGIVDVSGHGKIKWTEVPTRILINGYNTIDIALNNVKTENHFPNGLQGIVEKLVYGLDKHSSKETH